MAANLLTQHDAPHSRDGDTDATLARLPAPLTPFVGRAAEVASALELLLRDEVRLLTLTGPGGAGKTRMAIELATRAAPAFPDGARFIELTAVAEADQVIQTIALAFHVMATGAESPDEILRHLLARRNMLLVLDNFDQVVDAAPAIAELLLGCPGLKVLATSRIVLNIQGEHEFPVPALTLPESGPGKTWRALDIEALHGYDAIELFIQRARAVQPDFEISESNSVAIVNVCRRLDGLPLAIELAAARTKILSPEALLTRLARSLDVLSGGPRDVPPRLQTMRAAIAWSYDLLAPDEQGLFRSLAVFNAGFTLDAAEAVCEADYDVLSGVAALTNNSLLRRIEATDATPRFTMLETVREFGLELLRSSGRDQEIRARHADWISTWMEQMQPHLHGPEMRLWLDRFDEEHENHRSALTWLWEQADIERCVRLTIDSAFCWFYRGHHLEARDWYERLHACVAMEPSDNSARLLGMEAMFQEALGAFPRAIELGELSLAHARSVGDAEPIAIASFNLGDILDTMGEFEQAEQLLRAALAIFREQGHRAWLAMALSLLALIVHRNGDRAQALELVNEGLEHARATGFGWTIALCLNRQGRFASDAGDFSRAAQLYQESLNIWNELGDRWRVTRTLADVADCAAMVRRPDRAAVLLGAAEALNEPLAPSLRFADDSSWRRAHAEATARLDPESFERLWAEGRSMSWDAAVVASLQPLATPVISAPDATAASEASLSPLSPREQEVLQLLIAGRTDREIAEALFISPRTAQGHVASICNKLGVNSRTAAVAAALQTGLLP